MYLLFWNLFSANFIFHLLFRSPWKNSLRPLRGCSFRGTSSGGCRPVFSGDGGLHAPVLRREPVAGTKGTCVPSETAATWSLGTVIQVLARSFHPEIPSDSQIFRSGTLFNLLRISAEVEIQERSNRTEGVCSRKMVPHMRRISAHRIRRTWPTE